MSVAVGLQLYSVRNSLAQDPWGTLEKVAAAGFKYVEAANHNAANDPGVGFGVSAGDMRNKLDDLGLKIVGCHINPLDVEILQKAIEYQAELGNTRFGCDIEFFPVGDRDYVLSRCEMFNSIGELANQHGIEFYYHNHFQEFQQIDGQYVYNIILENTDPELVKLELDTFWMYRGGVDPLTWMKSHGDRIVLLHQKDFPAESPQPSNLFDGVVDPEKNIDRAVFHDCKDPKCFVEIGTGTLPIQDIIDAAGELPNLDYLILEQDHTQLDEIESINASATAFRNKFTGVTFD